MYIQQDKLLLFLMGQVLKHTKESSELKEQRESLRKCLNKTLSVNGKKVYNSKPTNNE